MTWDLVFLQINLAIRRLWEVDRGSVPEALSLVVQGSRVAAGSSLVQLSE